LESGLSLCRAPTDTNGAAFRQGPSSLYTFRAARSRRGLARGCRHARAWGWFPEFDPIHTGRFRAGCSISQVPCVYQFRHPGSGRGAIVSHAAEAVGRECGLAATTADRDGRPAAGVV
jgi:hypothetical protein